MNERVQDLMVCGECGSTNITCLAHINPNSKRFQSWWESGEECFCDNCDCHQTYATRGEWLKQAARCHRLS